MKLKAVLFDADGMVINKPHLFSWQYSRDFGVEPQVLDRFFVKEFQPCLTGEADLKELLKFHLKEWQWPSSVDELLEYWFKAEHFIDEQVVSHIKKLRSQGVTCVLATNNEKYRTEYMKTKMGFNEIFDTVYSSCYLGLKKPDPKYYEAILRQLGSPAKDSVIVWDDDARNIAGARSIGLPAKVYTDFKTYQQVMSSLS